MINSHGTSRPYGAKSSLNFFPSFVGHAGVSATRLSGGSAGGVFCGFGCGVATDFGSLRGGSKGTISRLIVSGSCWFAVALVEVLRVTNEAMWEGRRLLTRRRMITRPMRKSVSAPVGERKKLRKRRGFIVGYELA